MFEIRGEIPEPIVDEIQGGLVGAEDDRPLLEVRCCGDGHPPVTEKGTGDPPKRHRRGNI